MKFIHFEGKSPQIDFLENEFNEFPYSPPFRVGLLDLKSSPPAPPSPPSPSPSPVTPETADIPDR